MSARADHQRYANAQYMAQGELYRAIVSVPELISPNRREWCERIVFFDLKSSIVPGPQIVDLLALTWNVDTSDWRSSGRIYNVRSGSELRNEGLSAETWMRIYETGCGAGSITYCNAKDVELFVAPRMRHYMLEELDALPRVAQQ